MSFRTALAIAVFLAVSATAAAADDQPIKVSASDRAACMPDARRLCRDALPNVYRVLVCFRSHREKISSGCNAVLASYGF
jgi:hypothetical protein